MEYLPLTSRLIVTQKHKKQQVLARMWRKRNLHALLVGMHTGAAIVESSMEGSQTIKKELSHDPVILLLGIYPKKMKTLVQKDIFTPVFIEASFTIAKLWKQLKCPSTDEWIKMWHIYIYNGILLSHKK